MMGKRKTIAERKWNLWKLRSWLIKQGVLDTEMPCAWSTATDDPYDPVNEWRFILSDNRLERLEKVAPIIRRNGGYAYIEYNELSAIASDPIFYNRPLSQTWSHLVIDMRGHVKP